jgi:flagellar biosynthesis/type III secretory pathway chaperone
VEHAAKFSAQLDHASNSVEALHALLTREFDALQQKNLDLFQNLQPDKIKLLKEIQKFDTAKNEFLAAESQNADLIDLDALLLPEQRLKWTAFLSVLKECDILHRKIDQYLSQKIQTTNKILEILQVNKAHNATRLYDAYGNTRLSTIGNKITEA